MTRAVYLVAGALGVIGRSVVAACHARGYEAIAMSRRPLEPSQGVTPLQLDLLDAEAVEAAAPMLRHVTHLVYAAYLPAGGHAADVAPNVAMLRNLLEVLAGAPALTHITLLQGAKAYGSHLGPFKTPALESDPRHLPPNFYYDQHDLLLERQAGAAWSWTILRPTTVYGFSTRSPMNLITLIAVYAAICSELGLPLRFPGPEAAYRVLRQAVSAELVAEASLWAGETPGAADEIFNVTNGDCFRWCHLWPFLAERFGMEVVEPQQIDLAATMADKGELWDRIVARHELRRHAYEDLVAWPFGDVNFNIDYDNLLSTSKLRSFGFPGFADSFAMFDEKIAALRSARIIPESPTGRVP